MEDSAMKKLTWALYRDGKLVGKFKTETEVWQYLHRTHAASVGHLLRHEGYEIKQEVEVS